MQDTLTPFQTKGLDSVYDLAAYTGPPENIWSLKIGWNKVETPSKSLSEMVNLQSVEIRGLAREDLVPLFEELAKLPRLLDLSFGLWPNERFPQALGRMKTLERMRFRCTSYPEFPDFMRGMGNLRHIELDIDKWLGDVSHLAVLGELPRLESFDLTIRDNLPNGLETLRQLKRLRIFRLESKMHGLDKLTSLEDLILQYRYEEKDLTADLGDISVLTNLQKLRVQTWGKIVSQPAWTNLEHLEEIDLSLCNLTMLPEVIATLPKLKRLNLSHNKLETLPDWIGNIPSLEEITLHKNKLKRLPAAFSRLSKLKKVDLTKNKLGAFPKRLLELPNLQFILLAENAIENYPKGTKECPALVQIDLSDNDIAEFPVELLKLASAEILVKGNPFAEKGGYKMEDVLQVLSKETPSSPMRPTLLALAIGDVALARKTANMAHILFALNHSQEKLRAYALVALSQMLPNPFDLEPKPNTIAILGQSKGYPVWGFEKKLAAQGIVLMQNKPAEADIVVIGERPGNKALSYLNNGIRAASMPQLAEFVASFEQPWLREKVAELPKMGENFQRLWTSKAPENIKMALEMMTAGGIPEGVSISEVVAVSLFFPDAETRKLAAKFVTAKGSAAVRAYILANSRDLISISEESLKEYVFRFLDFLGDDAPGFAKMVYHLRPKLKDCYTPYMKEDELREKLVKRGDLALDQWEIPVFPMYFHEIKRLKGLTIRRYGLKKLPAGLTDIQGLRRLDLGQNELSRLPDDFQNLTQLEHLLLRSNSFSEVPEVLAHLPKLAYIDLSFNPFKTLPAFLSKLPALNELGLHRCHLASFPPVLKEIPLLVELSISFVRKGDHVKEIVKEILQMRNLKRLYLAKYHQAHLPVDWDLPLLESLRLDKSEGLVDLPDAIGNCRHLKVLYLDGCTRLTSLPSNIGNLSRLEEINLRGTRISLLPASFSKLSSLKKLVLPSGKFKDSGATIAILKQLPALKEIDCAGHRNELFISALKMNFPMILIRD